MKLIRPDAKPWWVFISVWLASTVVVTGAMQLLSLSDGRLGERLHAHGAIALATVTDLEPRNHNSIDYEFVVNGTKYLGGGTADGPEGVASELSVGQSVHVFYDKTDPDYSCYCDRSILYKQDVWWRNALAAAFVTCLVPVIVTLNYRRRRVGRGWGRLFTVSAD